MLKKFDGNPETNLQTRERVLCIPRSSILRILHEDTDGATTYDLYLLPQHLDRDTYRILLEIILPYLMGEF